MGQAEFRKKTCVHVVFVQLKARDNVFKNSVRCSIFFGLRFSQIPLITLSTTMHQTITFLPPPSPPSWISSFGCRQCQLLQGLNWSAFMTQTSWTSTSCTTEPALGPPTKPKMVTPALDR